MRIHYQIPDLDLPGATQAIDVAAALGRNLMSALLGSDETLELFEFPYPRPGG